MTELKTTISDGNRNGTHKFRQEILFWSTAGLLLFLYLWTPVLWKDEMLQAEILREMRLSGNWFHGALNWQIIPEHPVLGDWCTLPFVKLFGITPFSMRLPSALGALGALYALRLLGKKLFDDQCALMSCWMFLGSAGFLIWGRTAAPDMASCAAVIMAAAWAFSSGGKWGFFRYLVFYLLCFAGAFFKDISALIFPGIMFLPLLVSEGRWKKHLNWQHFFAFSVTLGLCWIYFHIAALFSPAPNQSVAGKIESSFFVMVWQIFLNRLGQIAELRFANGAAIRDLLVFLLPWVPLLPVGIAGLLKHRKALSVPEKRLFTGFCAAFLLYYFFKADTPGALLMPVPFILLFSAAGFCRCGEFKWNKRVFSVAYYLMIVCASLCIGSILGYPLWERLARCTPPAALVLAPVAAGALAWGALFMDHKKNNSLCNLVGLPHPAASVLLAGTLLSGCAFSVLLPVVHLVFDSQGRFFAAHQNPEEGFGYKSASFMESPPAACLFYSRSKSQVPRVDDLKKLIHDYPGEKVLLFFKERKETLELFLKQCRQYGISEDKNFTREELSRWSAPDARDDRYVSYLITLPGKRSAEEK